MEQSKIDMFVMQHNKQFAPQDMMVIRQRLEKMDDNLLPQISAINYKNPTTTLIFAWLLSGFGVDCFYCGKIGLGIAKLLVYILYMFFYIACIVEASDALIILAGITAVVMFVLFIICVINGSKWTRQYNFKKFMEATQMF